MLRDLALWWTEQMRALLPRVLLRDVSRADALLAMVDGSDLQLYLRSNRLETRLGSFAVDDAGLRSAAASLRSRPRQVLLCLDRGALLERQVILPLAAERDAAKVLAYEMDRLTPFAAADVFWTSKLLRRDRARGRIELRLSLVPKAALQSAIAVLHRIGAAPTAIEVPVPGGGSRHIALGAPQAGRDRLVATSCALVVLLLLAALVVPFVAQALTRGAVERRIAELKPRTAEVQALRDRIAAGSAGTDAIDSERARTGDALQVVATITELMPDDTVLSELSLHQGKLAISGHARSAAQLIPALAASPAIRNPAFSAPVIRSPDGNVDVFTVHAELSP